MLAEAREVNADGGIAAGIFIPVPFHFARLFPDKSEYDDSVPHFTLLYIGDITPEQQATVVDAVREVARDWSPFRMDMLRYHEFTNKDGKTIAHMVGSATLARPGGDDDGPIYRGLGSLHADLFAAIEATGIPVGHTYGHLGTIGFSDRADAFTPHATLAYAEPGTVYDGPKPRGSWTVKDIEVWGHERYQIPLGKTVSDQPDAMAEQLAEDSAFSPSKEVKKRLYPAIEKAAGALVGKELSLIFPKWSYQGFDAAFKEGGVFKLRPKPDGVVLAKLEGLPQASSRWLGVGTSIPTAIAALKPRLPKEKDDPPAPITQPAPPVPVSQPVVKPPETKPGETPLPPKLPKPPKPKGGPAHATINRVQLINNAGLSQESFDIYASALADATSLLKKRGFGFLLGRFKSVRLEKALNPGVAGEYEGSYYVDPTDKVERIPGWKFLTPKYVEPDIAISVASFGSKPDPRDVLLTMIHEIGHHYYYREMPRSLRKQYEWYFKRAKATKGDFPSDYGATKKYEDFAEIFAAFVGRGSKIGAKFHKYQLTPDIMDRFRTFLSQDERIDLRAEEKDSLYARIVSETTPSGSLFDRVAAPRS